MLSITHKSIWMWPVAIFEDEMAKNCLFSLIFSNDLFLFSLPVKGTKDMGNRQMKDEG